MLAPRLAILLLAAAIAAPRPAAAGRPCPRPLAAIELQGQLQDGRARLRGVLADVVEGCWGPEQEEALRALLERLQYRLERLEVRDGPQGAVLALQLRARTLIRHVPRRGELAGAPDDLLRRVSLRPGVFLPNDEEERAAIRRDEARRIEAYLATVGYFDARAEVRFELSGDGRQAIVFVTLFKGPEYRVGRITVTGNASLEDDQILRRLVQDTSYLFFRLKDRFSQERLREDLEAIEKIYQRMGFPRARVRSDFDPRTSLDRATRTVRLAIQVAEQKRIDLEFLGNASVTGAALARQVTFAEERSYDDYELQASAEAIRRYYQAQGFYQAIVTPERVRLLPTYERVIFHIDEGPRLPVVRLLFEGNATFSADRLREVVSIRPLPGRVARSFESGGYLTSTQLRQDAEALVEFYRREGFPEARVEPAVAPHARLLDDLGALAAAITAEQRLEGLTVRFQILEGPRRVVRGVVYLDNRALADADLEADAALRAGVPFTEAALDEENRRVLRRYADAGYPYARVTTEWRTPDGRSVYVRHTIQEGRRAHLGQVLIRGNVKTKDWVIRDALGFRPGDLHTTSHRLGGERSLRATGLFSRVSLDLIGHEQGRETVHVVASVQEAHDNNGVVDVAVGGSTDNLVFANLSYLLGNLGGIGASFLGRGEYGFNRRYVQGNLSFPPWILRRVAALPLQLDLTGSYYSEDHRRFDQLTAAELRATLSRPIGPFTQVSFGYSYRQWGRVEPLIRPAGSNQDLDKVGVRTTTASIGANVIHDRRRDDQGRPSPLNPTRGYRLTAGASWASEYLGGTDDFLKLSASGQWYVPLGRRLRLTYGLRYDHGVPLGGAVLLPEVERFFAGGDTTVRGFSRDHLHTEIIRSPLPGEVETFRVVPAGGNIRAIQNVDLQLQVWDRSFVLGFPMASAIFVDSGLVTNSFARFDPRLVRHSVGLALVRIVVPFVGSASFEYAIPLAPQPGDDPAGRFHFNLGFVF